MKTWKKLTAGFATVGVAAGSLAAYEPSKYADPPPPHALEQTLEISSDRGRTKADVLSKVIIKGLLKKQGEFSLDGINVEISTINRDGSKLVVYVDAWRDGQKLEVDNPLVYINPPVKVPTGKYHIEERLDGSGNPYEIDVANYKVDPEAALKQILVQTIKLQNNL